MNQNAFKPVALAGLLTILLATASFAQPTLVTDRASLGGIDFVDWSGFGPDFTTVPSGSTINSNMGLTVTVSMPSGDFERRDQGTGWGGNFAPGDPLLWTANNPGPMEIAFATPVAAAGAQIQRDSFGTFTAEIQVFDASDMMIASFSVPGDSTSDGDNSAIFLGVQDTSATIARIEYNVDSTSADFAINQLDIGASGVPTMSQLGLVLLVLMLVAISVFVVVHGRVT